MAFEGCAIEATRGSIQAGELQLSYLEWAAEGPPIMLLHGITSNAQTLWQVAPALCALGYHVYAMDMPGHGASETSSRHTINAMAELVGAAIASLGLRRLTLIGHSWGGATSLVLASGSHPARAALARVVLVDPVLAMNPEIGATMLPNYVAGVGQPAATTSPTVQANNPDWHPCDVHWKATALEQCRQEQVAGFFVGSGAWFLAGQLALVDIPLYLLVADPAYSIIPADRIAELDNELRPGLGTLQVVAGTTHNMLRGRGYKATMAALSGWLEQERGQP